ncbi:hypothetical protein RHMOL_Rhmol13G0226500 [Rhododendron molle]|uniref:Uncharacterized protein n=1 Tax=Rhododendron molle TaxID=49168 RepID=A0ACC0LB34_RHOML|nr:hypothetical protein RHMOL_Rhmol13G0226500 [Rhododendron molle]
MVRFWRWSSPRKSTSPASGVGGCGRLPKCAEEEMEWRSNCRKWGVFSWQAVLLEINLVTFPNVADVILANAMFSHYDCLCIALTLKKLVAKEYSEHLGVDACIKLFEQFKSYEGLYFFHGSYLSSSEDPGIHFKCIEVAA